MSPIAHLVAPVRRLATIGILIATGIAATHDADSQTTFIAHDAVAAAFAKGAPLVETDSYKVHASRRERPGQAEVHEVDTDIIYVLQGSVTFVTGGTVTEGTTIGPAEIRGSGIANGEERRLVPGDFIIVPAGVPHWFKSVDGPFVYYVVKVPNPEMKP